MGMMGEWVISLHQLFWLPLGHAGSWDAASHIRTVAVFGPACAQNKCTNIGVTRGRMGRDLTGNFSRFVGLKEFVTYHPLHFSVHITARIHPET